MCIYSKFWIEWEKMNLAPYATHSSHPWYSLRGNREQKDTAKDRFGSRSRYRTSFEIDKDRITNSQAFRRLEYKTQVFVTHEGDNYRTRLTHSLEVSEIARHIARALRLNEDLVEAIALGHDLGHAPYGHVAEHAINQWVSNKENGAMIDDYYFCHNRHSVEIVDHLEPGYDWDARENHEGFAHGLNLTNAVREGILVHVTNGYRGKVHQQIRFGSIHDRAMRRLSKANNRNGLFYPGTLEAQVVRISDDLAQSIHDIEDGFRSGLITKEHLKKILQLAVEKIKNEILDDDNLHLNSFLEHKKYGTKISKAFISDIIDLFQTSENNSQDETGPRSYNKIDREKIDLINDKIKTNKDVHVFNGLNLKYADLFAITSVISFLLHMWRDEEYLDHLTEEDQRMARTRILKYTTLYFQIMSSDIGSNRKTPAYHFVAFLRGIMLANVIEHSFWNLQKSLDCEFRKFHRDGEAYEKVGKIPDADNSGKCYVAFVIVDGFIIVNEDICYKKPKKNERIYCFEFNEEQEREMFLKNEFRDIISSNGCLLFTKYRSLFQNKQQGVFLKKINWLNKSEIPKATEIVRLTRSDGTQDWVPIESIKIYYTGYLELCPGSDSCRYGNSENNKAEKCKDFENCVFKSSVRYPDINRVINFQPHMRHIHKELKKLIRKRLHNRSRIARMNYMGEKIITYLLDLYYSNPRIMHDRVWSKLRVYQKKEGVSTEINDWINMSQQKKNEEVFEKPLLDLIKDRRNSAYENNRITLARRVIEHVAGMTDRYIANEYNRANQSGREVEIQDETYLFN